jgi:hypothetical protein
MIQRSWTLLQRLAEDQAVRSLMDLTAPTEMKAKKTASEKSICIL